MIELLDIEDVHNPHDVGSAPGFVDDKTKKEVRAILVKNFPNQELTTEEDSY